MEYQHINNLYGSTLVTLVKGMKYKLAEERIRELVTNMLMLGYSKQELAEYINMFLKEEKIDE